MCRHKSLKRHFHSRLKGRDAWIGSRAGSRSAPPDAPVWPAAPSGGTQGADRRDYRSALARMGMNEDVADEVAQAALCKAIAALHTFRGEAALFTWVCVFRVNRGRRGLHVESQALQP
jgi:hypothetical protein